MSHQKLSENLSNAVEMLQMPEMHTLLGQLRVSAALDRLEQRLGIIPLADQDIHMRLAAVKKKVQDFVVAKLPDAEESLRSNTKLARKQVTERRALLALISEFRDVLNESEKLRAESALSGKQNKLSEYRAVLDEEPVPFAGVVIRALIRESGLSQNEVARQCGMGRSEISRYTSNRLQIKLRHVKQIAEAMGVRAEDIVSLASEAFLADIRKTTH